MSKTLVRLKQQCDRIENHIRMLEAREKKEERKREVQRTMLVGAYYLAQARKQGKYDDLVKQIDPFLTRNSDRKLFNLPALTSQKKPIKDIILQEINFSMKILK